MFLDRFLTSFFCVYLVSLFLAAFIVHPSVGIRNMNSKDGMSMEEMRKLIEK